MLRTATVVRKHRHKPCMDMLVSGGTRSMDTGKLHLCVLKARNMPGQQAALYVRVISGSAASSAEVHEDRSTTVSLGDLFTLPVTPGQQQIAVEVWLRGSAGAPDVMLGGTMVDMSTLSASDGDVVPIQLHDSTGAVRGVLDCTGSITWPAKGTTPSSCSAAGYPAPASAPGASSAAAAAAAPTAGAPPHNSPARVGAQAGGPWLAYGAPAPGLLPPAAAAAPGAPSGPPGGYYPGTYPQQQQAAPPGAVPGGWPPGPYGPPGQQQLQGPPPPGYPGTSQQQQLPMAAGYQAPLQQQQPPMQGARPPGKPGMPAWGTTAAAAGAGVLGGMLVGNAVSHLNPFHHHEGYGGGGGWGGGNTETIIVENNNGGWGGGGEQVIVDGGGGWGGGEEVVVEDFGGGDAFGDDGGGGDW